MNKINAEIKRAMSSTQENIRTIKGHIQSIGEKEDASEEDLNLLLGRLQYQVKQLETDLKGQSTVFSRSANTALRGTQIKENNAQGDIGSNSSRQAISSQTLRKHSAGQPNQFSSAKHLMSASKAILNKNQLPQTASTKISEDQVTSEISPRRDLQSQEFKRSFYFQKNFIAEPGKISHSEPLPKQIRKNPFSDLPPISEKDLSRGLYHLVSIGLIPKDLDLLPAFNQGAPVLESQKKMLGDPNTKFNRVHRLGVEFPEKYKLEPVLNNSAIQPSILFNSTNLLFQNNSLDSNFFVTDINQNQSAIAPGQPAQPQQITKKPFTFSKTQAQKAASENQKKGDKIQLNKNYFITIKNGYIISGAADYKEMKNAYSEQWGCLNGLLKKLQGIAKKYEINLMYVDGNKLLEMANDLQRVKIEDLIDTLTNKEMIKKVIPTESISSFRGRAWATLKILCSFKMKKAIKELKLMRENQSETMEKKWKVQFWLKYMSTQRKLKKIQETKLANYMVMQKYFEQNYSTIVLNKRVEVHINSLSVDEFKRNTTEHFLQRQNLQLTRIFAIKDPNVEIIMVVPFDLPTEILSYYYKICELGDLQDYKERIHFIYPENTPLFPKKFPLAKLLYYSPKALKRIKQIINNKPAYIVPGMPSKEDNLIGMQLNTPLFSGSFNSVYALSGKSAAKKLIEECKLPTAPGAENISSEDDLVNQLTILIAKYANVNKWIFKVNGEFRGRGVASFSLESIRVLSDIRKQKRDIDEAQVAKIREIVSSLLPSKTVIATPTLFSNYYDFLSYFVMHKGIIEAAPLASVDEMHSPSILFRLEPSGNCHVIASYDKISGADFVNFASIFPQQSLPSLNHKQLCQAISDKLHTLNIYGYITIDLVSFPDLTNKLNHPLFWIIGLDCFLNDYSASAFIFDFLAKGKIDKITGKYYLGGGLPEKILPEENEYDNNESDKSNLIEDFEERSYMYIPYLHHRGLNQLTYRDFFQMCRKNGISFDIEKKAGSVFLLVDDLDKGVLSVMTIAENPKKDLKFMTDALNFILQIAGVVQRKTQKDPSQKTDQLYFMDMVSKVRTLNKGSDKQQFYQGVNPTSPPNNNDKSY